MQKKEKKTIDLKSYIKLLDGAIGRKDKAKEVMANEVMFKKYLISLGMNPQWTELAAVMEIIKGRFYKALKDKSKGIKIQDGRVTFGKNNSDVEVTPNVINLDEFELGTGERLKYSNETRMIEYTKSTARTNFEKREIDPQTGVVVRHLKRFGGNAVEETDDDCYSMIECTRDPEKPLVEYKTIYKNMSEGSSEVRENKSTEYDYAYPIELEKNGTTHRKTPIYFIKRYPSYEKWFNRRFRSRDEFIQNVFDMQKSAISRIWRDQRRALEDRVVAYSKAQDKLDVYYAGLQEIFNTSIIGPVYRLFVVGQIESIIANDELGIFYEAGSGEKMLQEIMARLNEEVNPKTLEEIIKRESAAIVARIGSNEDYQAAKETFKGNEVKSVDDDDYSIEIALAEIHDKSNIVEEFQKSSNPFAQEGNALQAKIDFTEQQMRILKTAYKAFPRRKRSIKEAIKEIEDKKVNPNNGDGR